MSARSHRKAVIGLSAAMSLFICTAVTTRAEAIPTFGAFANTGFRWEGGFGDFDASAALSWNHSTTGATVAASADLATGSLHSSSTAFQTCAANGCGWGWGAGADARLFDRYVFTNTGENIALIPVSLRIDGHCAGGARKLTQYRFAFSSSPINLENVPYRYLPCDGSVDVVEPINFAAWLGDTSYYAFVEISTGISFRDFEVGTSFGVADFGNTLKVDIVLPEGVTMHSDSGVFPYRYEVSNVPEPSALALVGAGGLVAWFRRRKSNRDTSALTAMGRRLLVDIGIGRGEALGAAPDVGLEQLRRSPLV